MRPLGAYLTVILCSGALDARAAVAPADSPAISGNPRAAVWKARRVDFFYVGRTSRYSCDGLRDKVRAMLIDLGARLDPSVTAVGCSGYDRMSSEPARLRLKIEFVSAALPEPGARPIRPGDLAAVDAHFQPFRIASDAFRNMGIGDCELVQQFSQQILSKFTIRGLKLDVLCVPYQPGSSRFLVRGEILRPLPAVEERALHSGG